MRHAVHLTDLQMPHILAQRRGHGDLQPFAALPEIHSLDWPLDVVEQWLWDFLDWPQFLADYEVVDLAGIAWQLELLPAQAFLTMTTGPSEADLLQANADLHEHWTRVRPTEIQQAWHALGTWLRPPVVLDRVMLDPSTSGLQVVEGRTRVGILWGRLRDGLRVADTHLTWVGRRA